jgi:hypothetical protein
MGDIQSAMEAQGKQLASLFTSKAGTEDVAQTAEQLRELDKKLGAELERLAARGSGGDLGGGSILRTPLAGISPSPCLFWSRN